jgi:small conductance mechanosensitive channel
MSAIQLRTFMLVALFLLSTLVSEAAEAQAPALPGSEAVAVSAGAASSDSAVASDGEIPRLPPEVLNPGIERGELEIRLVPMTRSELAALAGQWRAIVKAKGEELAEAQIALVRSDGTAAEQIRTRLSRLAEERRVLVDRFLVVLDGLEAKGAPQEAIAEYRSYVDAVIDKTISVLDLKMVLSGIGSWLADEEGGIAVVRKLLIALVSLYGLVLIARVVRGLVRRHVRRIPRVSNLLQTFLARLVYWIVLAVGLLVVLALLGVEGTPLLALFGGASVIIGLALQDTLGNFTKGLIIMMNRPFDEGDYVDIGGTRGTVQSLSIVATTISTPDNQIIVIPNQQVWQGVITNLTARDTRRVDLVFSIGYDDDIHLAIRVLKQAVAGHPLTLKEPEPTIAVTSLAESSVDILCGSWTKTIDYLTVYRELLADVKTGFDAAGITIPYPQRDLHLHATAVGQLTRPSDDDRTEASDTPAAIG